MAKQIVYLAGPFFTENELSLVKKARAILEDRNFEVIFPYEIVVPDKDKKTNKAWAKEMVTMLLPEIHRCDFVVSIYHGMYSDTGTAWELGYAAGLGKKILNVCVNCEFTSIMVINGCTSSIDDIEDLKTYDFNEFTPSTTEIFQM